MKREQICRSYVMEDDADLGSNPTAGEDRACEEGIVTKQSNEQTAPCKTTLLRLANLRDAWLVAYNSNRSKLRESDAE